MVVHFQFRKFYDPDTGVFERVDYWVRSRTGKIVFIIHYQENGKWSWVYKSAQDFRNVYDLPTFPDTSLMSEEELFQFSTVWDSVYGSDEMDFEEVQLIQKSTAPLRSSTVQPNPYNIRIPEYELSYYSDEEE